MNIIRLNSIGEPFAKSGQATPPSGGGTEGESHAEYYSINWEKAKELGWINDTNNGMSADIAMMLANCESAVCLHQDMIFITKISYLIVSFLEQQMSLGEIMKKFVKVKFIPTSIMIAQNGSVVLQEEVNTFSDVYPGLNTQGVMTPITKEQFYTL